MEKRIIKIVNREFELEVNPNIKIDGLIGYPQFTDVSENDKDYSIAYASNEIQEFELDLIGGMTKNHATHGILEIGVARPSNGYNAFTYKYLKYKSKQIPYVGVDIDDKSFLNNIENNTYSIQCNSEEQSKVRAFLKEKGINEISILSIDGWHSLNTVINDWRYTDLLVKGGIVIFHDSNYHPGVNCFIPFIDRNKFEVTKYFVDADAYGITIAKKL